MLYPKNSSGNGIIPHKINIFFASVKEILNKIVKNIFNIAYELLQGHYSNNKCFHVTKQNVN